MPHKSQDQLSQVLTNAATQVTVGARYRHYKNQVYTVLDLAILEATDEVCVIYRAEYGNKITFIRPLAEWLEQVEPNGQKQQRFTKIY